MRTRLIGLMLLSGVACRTGVTPDDAPIVSLQLQPGRIVVGGAATLSWSSANATRCAGAATPELPLGDISAVASSEGVSLAPAAPGSYRITVTCDGPGGSGNASAHLVVDDPVVPALAYLAASAASAGTGDIIRLTWEFTGATGCVASGAWTGTRAAAGTETRTLSSAGALQFELACDIAGTVTTASVTVVVIPSTVAVSTAFLPNDESISTSEGAPYGDVDFWQDLSVRRQHGYGPPRVVRLYICLSGMDPGLDCSEHSPPTGLLSAAMLDEMDQRIASFAGSGVRVMPRFIYNFGPVGAADVPASLIVQHIDQLAPILLRHRDLIFALEAGFIGAWGEWHGSSSGNDNATARRMVLDRELAHFRNVFPILLRYPAHLLTYLGTTVPDPALGLHDDYFASDDHDGGTWFPRDGFSALQLQDFAAAVARASMFVAEFGALYPTLQSCDALHAYVQRFPLQSLSLNVYPPEVAEFLRSQGCLLDLLNRVGPRIEVDQVSLSGSSLAGSRLAGAVTLRNTGYGRVIRARPADLVLFSGDTVFSRTPLGLDLRTLEGPGAAQTVPFSVDLPPTLRTGPISLGVAFPDPAPSLAGDPDYALPLNSVRPAGQPVFDAASGVNWLADFVVRGAPGAILASRGAGRR